MQIASDVLEFLVLACLKKEDLYGYSLTQNIQKHLQISESTLYPVLRRLQKKGFLHTYDSNFQGRNRRYYQITTEGLKELRNFITEWNDMKEKIDFLIREDEDND